MDPTDRIEMDLTDHIERELRRYASAKLDQLLSLPLRDLGEPSAALHAVPDSLVDLLVRNRGRVRALLDRLLAAGESPDRARIAQVVADSMTRALHDRNQYLVIGDAERDEMAAAFTRMAADFRQALDTSDEKAGVAASLTELVARHQSRLASFVRGLAITNVSPEFVYSEPVSSEYSADLQLRVLGVCAGDLTDPILDIGCGPRAALVQSLRAQDHDAFGIDRADPEQPHVTRADWLEHDLGSGQWGTVLSHLGFSNHFLHHHLRKGGSAERYARRYMDILRALKPGGRFLYAPGLPFIEDLLPRRAYSVLRRPITALAGSRFDKALRASFGTTVLYSSTVTRLLRT